MCCSKAGGCLNCWKVSNVVVSLVMQLPNYSIGLSWCVVSVNETRTVAALFFPTQTDVRTTSGESETRSAASTAHVHVRSETG